MADNAKGFVRWICAGAAAGGIALAKMVPRGSRRVAKTAVREMSEASRHAWSREAKAADRGFAKRTAKAERFDQWHSVRDKAKDAAFSVATDRAKKLSASYFGDQRSQETRRGATLSDGLWGKVGASSLVSMTAPMVTTSDQGQTFTLLAECIDNLNEEAWTGPLKLSLWASDEPYFGGSISGWCLCESFLGDGLAPGYGYPDVETTAMRSSNPPSGEYRLILLALERHSDGEWYIVAWKNFDAPFPWEHGEE